MATIDVKDAGNTTVPIEKPNANGRAAAAASRPVVLCNEDFALLDGLEGLITTLNGYVDGLEALATSLNGYVDGLETLHAKANATSRILSSAASTNATSVKGSAGILKGIQGYNARSSAVYLKLYNKATSPTVGTDTPVKTIYLPATSPFALDFDFTFGTGLALALTTGSADNDTGAVASGDILGLNVDYV